MGLFGLALVLGAILHLFWPEQADRRTQGERARAWLLWLVAGLVAYTAWTEWTLSPTRWLEAIGRGDVGRFVLGLVIGFSATRGVYLRRIRGLHLLWLGFAVLLIAVGAPHIDKWLSRLALFKTSAFELQLATVANTNYRVAVAADNEILTTDAIFFGLKGYHKRIEADIEFANLVEIPELSAVGSSTTQADDFVQKASQLLPFFSGLISPLAQCYAVAVDRGASIGRLKDLLRPLAFELLYVINNLDSWDADQTRRRFWDGFMAAAREFDKTHGTRDRKCSAVIEDYLGPHQYPLDEISNPRHPRLSDFGKLPYLYNAAAAIMSIVNEGDIGLKILEDAKPKIGSRADYFYLSLMAQLRLFQGHSAGATAALYEQMRALAEARQRQLSGQCHVASCDQSKKIALDRLRNRHRAAELTAMNSLVYRASEDLARGDSTAKNWEVAIEKYALQLKHSLDAGEVTKLWPGEENSLLDTYAYARIVLEAQKSRPDSKVFKDMQRILLGVLADYEKQLTERPSRHTRWLLEATRIHYNSARELSGE